MSEIVTPNDWQAWREFTPARLALGRAGVGMPTDETLRFGWAHAMARDAIHAPLNTDALGKALREQGWDVTQVRSRAVDRASYLRRPDLGRQLAPEDAQRLRELRQAAGQSADLCIVIGDGLSSLAAERHSAPVLAAFKARMPANTCFAPVVLATQARVALADEIAEVLGARQVVMMIGERPGLSSPDSLGLYLTHAPRKGCSDAERNCISNVRPEGLTYTEAAFKLAWLLGEARRLGLSGVALKDESDIVALKPE